MKNQHTLWALAVMASAVNAAAASSAFAAVSADEARKLGTTLTPTGAERAGSADKSIPDYTGGLTTPPASYVKGSGIRPDPYAGEKPLYSIKPANEGQYDDKLTAGTRRCSSGTPTSASTSILRIAPPRFRPG